MPGYSLSVRPRDECGVFAVHGYGGPSTAAGIVYQGLMALQHRGQESAGMAFPGASGLQCRKGMGLVSRLFDRKDLAKVTSPTVLGHVRYSTTGESNINNAQPLVARSARRGGIALAHNGNLSNNAGLRQALLEEGQIFHGTTDSETLLTFLFRHRRQGLAEAIPKAVSSLEGSYAAVVMDGRETAAFRDPCGFRPLVIGRLGEAPVFASETCALDAVGAAFMREVQPGEIVLANSRGELSSFRLASAAPERFCVFEFIYFARPDSDFKQKNVHLVRKAIGACLARYAGTGLDMVVPSPESGISAAMGLAGAAGLPLEWALHRNPYQVRTFIEPTPETRQLAARLKYSPVRELVRGKRLAVVDDSLVRGTTARRLTALLREAGACEVHLFISAPPYSYPCRYGIDIPVAAELAAVNQDGAGLAGAVGADSITFASMEDLFSAVGYGQDALCTACFTGEPAIRHQAKHRHSPGTDTSTGS